MMTHRTLRLVVLFASFFGSEQSRLAAQEVAGPKAPDVVARAKATLAQHTGTLTLRGVRQPVEVIRDQWGVPHIYAQSTHDLFFAQGYIAAQDHLWQMELWRRNGEGTLAEVLGPEYVERDKFVRLLTFRGDWDVEMKKYHPEGPVIFAAFADGVNEAITVALEEGRVPIEFELMGFQPQPVWTAKTVLTRMPAWTLSRNAATEISRALAVKTFGLEKAEQLIVTEPERKITVPEGLDLADIRPEILDLTRKAGDFAWKFAPLSLGASVVPLGDGSGQPTAGALAQALDTLAPLFASNTNFDLGSNNWVVGGKKSATGMPLLANDPHREVLNPALRNLVHLVAPGWNVIGMTEPGMPGISVGHNEDVAWGFTILGVDQEDIYVEETDPADPNRYLYKGQWLTMQVERELIQIKGKRGQPELFEAKATRHGPVIYEDKARHRAYALRWVGAEAGGAGYLGSLNILQAKNWTEFTQGVAKSWYLPSHSIVYADKAGNYGYLAAALSPIRKNWDGLMPVPGKDGKYEWDGFLPLTELPRELNGSQGYYASANNDVVPKLFPSYKNSLGFEYSAAFRFDRLNEVLRADKKFSVADFQQLQGDHVSLPARQLVPLFKTIKAGSPALQEVVDQLLAWDFVVDRDSVAATIYEYWLLKLTPLVYAAHLPPEMRATFRQYDVRRVIAWMADPDAVFGADPRAARDEMALNALEQALADLKKMLGDNRAQWRWGAVHRATFEHPLLAASTTAVAKITPIERGGDAFTVQATSNPTERGATEAHGASAMLVLDVQDWDRSVALNAPGNESQFGSAHYADLAPLWGEGRHFPLAFSKARVSEVADEKLVLHPFLENEHEEKGAAFRRVQTDLFTAHRPVTVVWGDYDNDGWPDLFVGYQGGMAQLFHNDHGHFVDVSIAAGISDSNLVRSAAWGDFDGDGNLDLYIGFDATATVPNRLYRGDGKGHFTDVAAKMGLNDWGESRQVSFVDFNNDGKMDLFVAFRDKANRLYRNDGDHFTEVSKEMGIVGPQSTVGGVWFDYNEDGRLDLFLANQNGSLNRVYRNDGDHFTNVAKELGMDGAGRTVLLGSVGIAVGDFNGDGRLDLYFANYGPSWLMRNDGGGKFTDVAPAMGVAINRHLVAVGWGDYDNDGKPDLYTCGYLVGHPNIRDYLLHNEGAHFSDVTPAFMLKHDSDHGVAWADYDRDGALDLALCDHEASGVVSIYHNELPAARAAHSLQVLVLDANGHYTKAGSEVRIYAAGTRKILGASLVDTGSGYSSQSVLPVHFGLPQPGKVDVEITAMSNAGRKLSRVEGVDPAKLAGQALTIKTNP